MLRRNWILENLTLKILCNIFNALTDSVIRLRGTIYSNDIVLKNNLNTNHLMANVVIVPKFTTIFSKFVTYNRCADGIHNDARTAIYFTNIVFYIVF